MFEWCPNFPVVVDPDDCFSFCLLDPTNCFSRVHSGSTVDAFLRAVVSPQNLPTKSAIVWVFIFI